MIKLLRLLLLLATLLVAAAAQAQVDTATAESLLRKAGLWEQMEHIAPQTQATFADMLAQSGERITGAQRERIAQVIAHAYAAPRLRAVSVAVVAKGLSTTHVPELQRWYDSPVGQSITKLEEADSADGTDAQTELQQGAAIFQKLPQQQRDLLEALLAATHGAEFTTQITINTAVAAQLGVISAAPHLPSPSERELRAALEAQRPQLMKGMSMVLLAGFAKTYATLSVDELQAYVDFAKSPAGSQFNTLCMHALDTALSEAAGEMGRNLPGVRDQSNT